MVDKQTLKHVIVSNQAEVENYHIHPRQLPSDQFQRRVLVGVRRAGKSFMLFQKMQQMLAAGTTWDEMLYINFEDDRLGGFTASDFEAILQCHAELSGKRPMLFLDEVQNIDGWEKFARRLADTKYDVWITGSNARMLSSEIMTTLGGRYLATEVFPYDLPEYLQVSQIPYDDKSLLRTDSLGRLVRAWNDYLLNGGLPESLGLPVKRSYLSSVFQKIYLGDIVTRNKIANPNLLRLLLKKLAETVLQPVSYNRLAQVLSSVSGKISTPTVCRFIECAEEAWLIFRLRNVSAPFADKETACKYYFVDNGILGLFLINGEPSLLENFVAMTLFRRYGHDRDNERVFFYNDRVEVDFYIPEDEMAIQVSYSIDKSADTYRREVDALQRLPKALPCKKRLIITHNDSSTITDDYGVIEALPAWRWALTV